MLRTDNSKQYTTRMRAGGGDNDVGFQKLTMSSWVITYLLHDVLVAQQPKSII